MSLFPKLRLKGFAFRSDSFTHSHETPNNTTLTMKRALITLVAVFALAGAVQADHQPGHKVLVLKNKDGPAILGYDAVAYFTDNKAVRGNLKIQSEYEGAKFCFASADHKKLFDANPAKYAPA